MANIVLTEAYNYAGTLNSDFSRNRDRWIFLLDSYVGGDDYRLGNYLVKYTNETGAEYQARCRSTPLDNHCRSVISVYISFLFREQPKREFGTIESDPMLQDFLADADMDGRSFNSFMKEVSIWSSVFGHCWVLMTKPGTAAETLADQLAQGVRPYVNLLTPLVVTDWRWERRANGRYDIVYFKYIEDVNDSVTTIREWTPDFIRTYEANNIKREAVMVTEEINELGRVPVVLVYNERSQVRGMGISDITDIADQQRAIYNEMSEVEQSVRLEGHPSLVVTPDTQIGAGAGAIIMMGTDLDPGLKPYMLNADATPINMIYESINNRVNMIDRMANTGSVRGTEISQMSGIAMETEFQLLNAKLSEKADNLELAEEQIWQLWSLYQSQTWTGSIEYPGSFNIRDTGREVAQLVTARTAATDPVVYRVIDQHLLELLGEESDLLPDAVTVQSGTGQEQHPSLTALSAADRQAHLQEMLMEGYTNDEILALHPEITLQDIIDAGAAAAASN